MTSFALHEEVKLLTLNFFSWSPFPFSFDSAALIFFTFHAAFNCMVSVLVETWKHLRGGSRVRFPSLSNWTVPPSARHRCVVSSELCCPNTDNWPPSTYRQDNWPPCKLTAKNSSVRSIVAIMRFVRGIIWQGSKTGSQPGVGSVRVRFG